MVVLVHRVGSGRSNRYRYRQHCLGAFSHSDADGCPLISPPSCLSNFLRGKILFGLIDLRARAEIACLSGIDAS